MSRQRSHVRQGTCAAATQWGGECGPVGGVAGSPSASIHTSGGGNVTVVAVAGFPAHNRVCKQGACVEDGAG